MLQLSTNCTTHLSIMLITAASASSWIWKAVHPNNSHAITSFGKVVEEDELPGGQAAPNLERLGLEVVCWAEREQTCSACSGKESLALIMLGSFQMFVNLDAT